MRSIGRTLGEGLMWMGFAWNGMCPPHAWAEYGIPLVEQPCLPPPLSEEELAEWTALVKYL